MNATPTLAIACLRSRAPAREPVIARLVMEALVGEVAAALPALPPQSVLVVRRLALAVAGLDLNRLPDSVVRHRMAVAAHGLLADAYGRAARPARGLVSERSSAVLFGDDAELLACLARDAMIGRLDAWWWRTLLGKDYPSWTTAWRDRPAAAPAALRLLTRAGLAASVRAELRACGMEVDGAAAPPAQPAGGAPDPSVDRRPVEVPTPVQQTTEGEVVIGRSSSPLTTRVSGSTPVIAQSLAPPPSKDTAGSPTASLSAVEATAATAAAARPHAPVVPLTQPPSAAPPSSETPAASAAVDPTAAHAAHRSEAGAVLPIPAAAERGPASASRPAGPARQPAEGSRLREARTSAEVITAAIAADRSALLGAVEAVPASAEAAAKSRRTASAPSPVPRARPADRLALAVAKRSFPTTAMALERNTADDDANAWPLASTPQAVASGYGRLLFLVNVLIDDGLYPDFTRPGERGFPVPIWRLLALLGSALTGPALRNDALWGLLDRLADELPIGDDCAFDRVWPIPIAPSCRHYRPPSEAHPWRLRRAPRHGFARWLARYQLSLRARLARALAVTPALVGSAFVQREGQSLLWVSAAEIVVVQALDEHPVEWRLAGLDRDPGYLPSAGRKLRFVFE